MVKTKLLIAGAGLIGRKHIQLSLRNTDCALAGIVDPSPAAADLAAVHGIPYFRNLEEALRSVAPDGVIIATPNRLHVEQGLACVERRIPVLVEKPIADTAEDAARLVEAAEQANVPLLVGHHRRHTPVLAEARRIISSGRLGRITAVMAATLLRKPDRYFAEAPWRKMKGGGPIMINLIHDIDNLRTLCGEIVSVQAFGSNAARGFEVEDTVAINLRFSSGALGTYVLSDIAAAPRSWDQNAGEKNSFASYPNEDCYVIAGDRGALSVPTLRLSEYGATPDWSLPMSFSAETAEPNDPHAAQLSHFLDVIAWRAQPLVSGRDAMRTLAVALAVAKAAETGLPVAC